MTPRLAGFVTGLIWSLAWSLPARADSEMHQFPLLDRGSPEACDAVRQGRVQRGGSFWQPYCPTDPRGDGRDQRAR